MLLCGLHTCYASTLHNQSVGVCPNKRKSPHVAGSSVAGWPKGSEMDQQQIADESQTLARRAWGIYEEVQARVNEEMGARKAELQRLCGAIGHVYVRQNNIGASYNSPRVCACCNAVEPKVSAPAP